MSWIFGLLFAVFILLPMFASVCRAEKPTEEDAKTLLGALD